MQLKRNILNSQTLQQRLPTLKISAILILVALTQYSINYIYYQFPGNNYMPPYVFILLTFFTLSAVGLSILFGKEHRSTIILKELACFTLVIIIICGATYTIQFTPFFPIDKEIVALQNSLHIPFEKWLDWARHSPHTWTLLTKAYNSLAYQLLIIPVAVIIFSQNSRFIHEFYYLSVFSALIGFNIYYFFPTTAPASNVAYPYFLEIQYATGLKFAQLHQWMMPTTLEGGLIALPSFHMIWAWFCQYLLRPWKLLFFLVLPINLTLCASCVLLGWHYPIDLFCSALVILMSHCAFYLFHKTTAANA